MICRKPESFCFISSPVMVQDGLHGDVRVHERLIGVRPRGSLLGRSRACSPWTAWRAADIPVPPARAARACTQTCTPAAALADGIDGAPGEILYGLDGRIGRHDVEQTEVADADDLELFVHVERVAVGLQIQLDDLDRRVVEVDAGLAGNLPDRDAR